MTNKIVAIQGNHPKKLNPISDTTIFLANEIQKKYKIFYYEPKNLSIINNDVIEIIVYDTFSIANSYTKAEADTRYPFLGNDSIIRTNGQTISADVTISSTTNALSAGPITVGASATLTVNGFYTIL